MAQSGGQTIASEPELVRTARAGDLDSFGKLCEHYYGPLVAIAYSVLRDHQLAEDAAQEAFARALVNLRKLNETNKFVPWLARICRNVAVDMLRNRPPQVNEHNLVVGQDHDEDEATSQIVREAIHSLPAGLREVVILRYYNNDSYEQISGVLGLSKMTINGRLTRAKRKLAKYLRRRGVRGNMP
jgi:RNA polymerase sigma-70 factor, ECF subfamily